MTLHVKNTARPAERSMAQVKNLLGFLGASNFEFWRLVHKLVWFNFFSSVWRFSG